MSLFIKWLNGSPGRLINHTSALEANVILDIALTFRANSLSWHLCPSLFSKRAISFVTDTGMSIAKYLLSFIS
jgi:hypothetical protein